MIEISAKEVPEIRARMADWARDPGLDGAGNWFRFFLGPHPPGASDSYVFDRVDDVAATIAGTLAVQLPASELFYVSSAMTELARHAASSLPDYRLHPEDLPSPVGFMVYAQPPVPGTASGPHDDVCIVSWGPGRGGVWVHTWAPTSMSPAQRGVVQIGRNLAKADHHDALQRARAAAARNLPTPSPDNKSATSEEAADLWGAHLLTTWLPNLERAQIPPSFCPPHGFEWCALTPMEFMEMEGWPDGVSDNQSSVAAESKIALQRTIVATWLLMGQTLVHSERVHAPRAARRRIESLDPAMGTAVRYIDLRRSRTEPSDHSTDDREKSGREYHHSWIVSGHWRNQYYPNRNENRPIWIDWHRAGPDDKPLIGGERVNVLRR
ncbi:hypothetical protein GCM10011609_76800 [Lentzea pudingi]|uniref:Uncharacterized protein n=1 Tax=Lentzea pudingi TaxID=1789439 RepID=A0ABQ2INT8_9PSEU|nr:hypothetical protein [Lentzea pudingi]GGN23782.1 hypothetical protein GCM10011609_76800 [Lentzea pudingi]